MRRVKVRHQPLPGIGELHELRLASGLTASVVTHPSGRRDLAIAEAGVDQPAVTTELNNSEAATLAALLASVHIELTSTPEA